MGGFDQGISRLVADFDELRMEALVTSEVGAIDQ